MSDISQLLSIMQRLRDPQTGCPWDVQQNFHTIAPYTVEEAYEVADAIERNDMQELPQELGDLLFQVVFHAQMGEEQGLFRFDDVVTAISEKLIRRHPHVFGDAAIHSAEEQTLAWEEHKALERQQSEKYTSVLDGIAKTLPGVTRAAKLQKRAAKVGFDWHTIEPIFDKLTEETDELKAELAANAQWERLEDEIGDMLFTVVNIARHADIDPELAIRRANAKFEARFKNMEDAIERAGQSFKELSTDDLESYWQLAKQDERS
ncbi:MAG: nucleoside triphosphate pyrophosphohydrolase [Gammaproteobacteria bacterium]|nr:nucleoside triphosphate pyrophosphohydrolase [Gammaproteobacteria bacterium]